MMKIKRLIVNRLLEVSLLLVFMGMLIMAIGSKNLENRYGFQYITLSPVIMLTGYVLVAVAIMIKKKTD